MKAGRRKAEGKLKSRKGKRLDEDRKKAGRREDNDMKTTGRRQQEESSDRSTDLPTSGHEDS